MRLRVTYIVLITFYCFSAAPLSVTAGDISGQGSKKNYLRWEAVEGAVSYVIHIKDSEGNLALDMRTKKSEYYFILKPGTYQVRIGAVNRFEKVVSWSDWSPLVIKEPVAPHISSVEPDKLPSSSHVEIIVKGRNFEKGAGIEIRNRGKAVRLEKCRVRDDDHIACEIITGPSSKGSYSIVVSNPGGITDSIDITVYRPVDKKKDSGEKMYVHGGYQFVQVLDKWQEPLHHGFFGFFFRGGIPFGRIPLLREWEMGKYFSLEGFFSYAYYSSKNREEIVASTLHQVVPGLYMAASLPLGGSRFFIQFRAGGGMAWHILVRKWTFGDPETSHGADVVMGAGTALSFQWTCFNVFAGIDYQLIFTGINLNHSLIYRAGTGCRF